jgi:hypothetical protein
VKYNAKNRPKVHGYDNRNSRRICDIPGMARIKDKLTAAFRDHPASVGEGYFEHMLVAFSFGARMLLGGAACLVHAVLPFLFTRTGSRTIGELHQEMVEHRMRRPADNQQSQEAMR